MNCRKVRVPIAVTAACAVSLAAGAAWAAQSWTKYADNPVVTEYGGYQPEIVLVGGTYHMFYTFRAPAGGPYTTLEVRHRTSTDGITWSAATTVLTPGAAGAWDDAGVYVDSVIYDGGLFKMWYTGRQTVPQPTKNAIGYATSFDGNSWIKHTGSNPVLTVGAPTAWDSQFVREAAVVKVGGTYHMWYAGTAAWPVFAIGYATSSDGLTWTKNAANPVLGPGAPGSWEDATVYAPQVVHQGGYFHMWYSAGDGANDNTWVLGYAVSCDGDGVTWTKEAANPVLGLGPAPDWDCGDSTDYNYVMNDGGTWKMWYSGAGFRCNNPVDYQIGYATLDGGLEPPPLTCPADLQVVKTVNNSAPLVGQNIIFTVTVTNNGPNSAINVVVNDVLPAGLAYVSDDGGGAYNSGTGVWTIGDLLPGGSATLNITATVMTSGTIVNLASVSSDTSDPDPGNNEDDAVIVAPAPTPTATVTPMVAIPVTSGSGLLVFVALLALAGVVALWRLRA